VEHRPGFWQAVIVAVLGHGAILAHLGDALQAPGPSRERSGPMAFQVSSVQFAAAAASVEAQLPQALAAALALPQLPSQPAPSPALAAAPAASPLAPPPMPQGQGAAPERAPEEAPYLPRSQLTIGAKPLAPVDVAFPVDVKGVVELKVKLTLYIDEQGVVQRIRIDTPQVHPSFERAIRETFADVRFTPGEREGVPVRSQLRLEVEFEAPGSRRPGS
jgi:TonB family protein